MPWTTPETFTAGQTLTAASMNIVSANARMGQPVYATTAARDAAITSPEDGMTVYIGSNDASEGLYTYNGTAWRRGPGWNAPWGFIGYAARTSNVSVGTGTSDITDCSITFTAVANRYYRVFGHTLMNSNHGAAQDIDFRIAVDGTVARLIPNTTFANPGPGDRISFDLTYVTTLTAGSRTIKLQGSFSAGASNTFDANTNDPSFILIEDIGPAGAPA